MKTRVDVLLSNDFVEAKIIVPRLGLDRSPRVDMPGAGNQ